MAKAKPSIPVWVALLGSGLAGVFVAAQSRINGGLSSEIGDGYLTAAVSFLVGLVVLCTVMLCSPTSRAGLSRVRAEVASGHLPIWALTGGLCGGFFVLGQGLVASVIGVAFFTVGIVAGQVLGGLFMDRWGLGPGGRIRPTPQRLIGTVLAVAAVVVAVRSDLGGTDNTAWLALIPLVAGLGVAWQSSVNGVVRAAAHSAVAATFINFVVGTSMLVVVAAVSVAVRGWPAEWPTNPWLYSGGVIGTIFIALAALLVRTAGVLLLSMSNVAGQLIASGVFEAVVPLGEGVTAGLAAGILIALVAVTVAALPSRRRG